MTFIQGLAVKETGDPQGAPVLLIHGGGGANWAWDETAALLPEFHCLMPDLPEHGSSRETCPFTIKDAAGRLAGIIRQVVPGQKAHIVGLSVGGQIAIQMLASTPQVIWSAVVSGAQVVALPGYRLGLYSERMMALVYWLGIHFWKQSDPWIRMNMQWMAGIPDSYFESFRQNFRAMTRNGWAHPMSENYRYRLPAGLESAAAPVLLIGGTKETVDIQPSLRLLQTALPRSRSVLVGNGRRWSTAQQHNWPMVAPELFAQTVRTWITGQPLPTELVDFQ